MNRIGDLNRRYAASAKVTRSGVEVVAVGDPSGARLNAAVRRLVVTAQDDSPELWEDLVGAAKALRWRLVTQPQPIELNPALIAAAARVQGQVSRLKGAVADDGLLDEVLSASEAVGSTDPRLGDLLLRSIEEVGAAECVVVAAGKAAQTALAGWLGDRGVRVLAAGELGRGQLAVDQAYVVGPPCLYSPSLVTAPVTEEVSFILPAWFGDRSIPQSAIAAYADGAIRVEARLFTEGDVSEPVVDDDDDDDAVGEVEDEFLPQPNWGTDRLVDREPSADEVGARKVLLSGNLAIWLDDGDRIRALAPEQPLGERVVYTEVKAVRYGTFLLLRRGENELGALYRAALARLPGKAPVIETAQKAWKDRLSRRLQELSYQRTVSELRARGVRTAERARAWTEPSLLRPNRDEDFETLLQWLDIPIQPTFGYATMLRRAHHQASADLREQLERAVSEADLSALERDGHWLTESKHEGIRGLIATRVLAISPYREIISRHDARVPFQDRSGQWLE
ncbi:hypothetical protein AB0I28_09625 [Phytomonospora sp. NPDC050363]|uniref:hypothetical protein n=1 Tax=Phytomonospora sp. NPDC050363 TaxID=3155642 RepID=UPI003405F5A4